MRDVSAVHWDLCMRCGGQEAKRELAKYSGSGRSGPAWLVRTRWTISAFCPCCPRYQTGLVNSDVPTRLSLLEHIQYTPRTSTKTCKTGAYASSAFSTSAYITSGIDGGTSVQMPTLYVVHLAAVTSPTDSTCAIQNTNKHVRLTRDRPSQMVPSRLWCTLRS